MIGVRRAAYIIGVNLVTFLIIVLCAEAGFRAYKYLSRCQNEAENQSCSRIFSWDNQFQHRQNIGMVEEDAVLGGKPVSGSFEIHDPPKWDHVGVHLLEDGIRSNGTADFLSRSDQILAVGNSFTFGAQVDDDETWAAYLEKLSQRHVINGGVPSYSTLQAVLRAAMLTEKMPEIQTVILSILTPADILRAGQIVRDSMIRPAIVVDEQRQLRVSLPSDHADIANRAMSRLPEWWYHLGHSAVLAEFSGKVFGYYGVYYVKHPRAAQPDDMACFLVQEFAKIPVGQKLVLLQYSAKRIEKGVRPPIADVIEECAAANGIVVVDSWPALLRKSEDLDQLYFDHMTAAGNKIIAEILAPYVSPVMDTRASH